MFGYEIGYFCVCKFLKLMFFCDLNKILCKLLCYCRLCSSFNFSFSLLCVCVRACVYIAVQVILVTDFLVLLTERDQKFHLANLQDLKVSRWLCMYNVAMCVHIEEV